MWMGVFVVCVCGGGGGGLLTVHNVEEYVVCKIPINRPAHNNGR